MNGLHSKTKLKQHFPQFDQKMLKLIYEGMPEQVSKNETIIQLMSEVNFDVFVNKTASEFKVVGCRYMDMYCNAKGDADKYWRRVRTQFGHCQEFSPSSHSLVSSTNGQKLSLSLAITYNQNDSSIGWFDFLSG